MDHLVEHGVKALVIACNSASAAVLRDARERYDVPVIEVIQPAVRRAARVTGNNRVAVIGTQATVTSGPTRTLSQPRRGSSCSCRPARVSSSSSKRASPVVQVAARRSAVSAPAAGGRRRHARARMYPLTRCSPASSSGSWATTWCSSPAPRRPPRTYARLSAHDLLRDPTLPEPEHRFLATGDLTAFATMGRRFPRS